MNHVEKHLMVSSREVDCSVLRMAIKLKYFDKENQNGECNLEILDVFPWE